jgi:hypothetical protein
MVHTTVWRMRTFTPSSSALSAFSDEARTATPRRVYFRNQPTPSMAATSMISVRTWPKRKGMATSPIVKSKLRTGTIVLRPNDSARSRDSPHIGSVAIVPTPKVAKRPASPIVTIVTTRRGASKNLRRKRSSAASATTAERTTAPAKAKP